MSKTMIKICGLSTPETVRAAVAAGATHIGLNLYEPSPRSVTVEQAVELRRLIPEHVQAVMLTVNMDAEATGRAATAIRPDVIQFHGAETPEWCAALKGSTPIKIWKAVGVKDASALATSQRFVGAVDMILYDAPAGKLPGGNGLALDWSLLADFDHKAPWGLAGGLTPENVGEAITQTKAPLVDTSSGVESAPGIKDIDKIEAFCQAVRQC